MGRTPRRPTSIALGHGLALVLAGLCGLATPAHATAAADTVVVPGTSFPDSSTYVTVFGCQSLYRTDTTSPLVRVVRDEAAPLGTRVVELDQSATGTAVGAVSLVDSIAHATSEVSVRADEASRGVAWVWYVAPGMAPGEVWVGRTDLVAAPDWQLLDPTAATYEWQRLEAATGAVRQTAPAASIEAFTAEHGDGPGYLLSGLGCDGAAFRLDAVRSGAPDQVRTYDLEGWPITTTITGSRDRVAHGEQVTLIGRSYDGAGAPAAASLVLQARPAGAADFRDVSGSVVPGPDGAVTLTLTPKATTDYRWFFTDRSYADAHVSPEIRIAVGAGPRESRPLD